MLDRMLANVAAAAARTMKSRTSAARRARREAHPTCSRLLRYRSGRRIQRKPSTAWRSIFADDNGDKDIRIEAIGRKGRDYFRRACLQI